MRAIGSTWARALLAAGLFALALILRAGALQSAPPTPQQPQGQNKGQGPSLENAPNAPSRIPGISLDAVVFSDDPEAARIKQAVLARSRLLRDVHFQVPFAVYRQYLIDQGQVRLDAPVPYIAQEGTYKLAIADAADGDGQTELTAQITIEAFSPPHCRNLPVLCGRDWADTQVNGKPTALALNDGWLRFTPPAAGMYTLTARLKAGGSNEVARLSNFQPARGSGQGRSPSPDLFTKPSPNGGRGFVSILPTTRTRVEFESPKPWDLKVNGWTIHGQTGPTKGQVALPTIGKLEMEYLPTAGKSAHAPRYELAGDIAWNQDAAAQQVSAALTVNITGDGSDRIDMVLPPAAQRVEVSGPEVREAQGTPGQATVHLLGKVAGATRLSVSYELPPGEDQRTWGTLGVRDGHWTGGTLIVTNSAGSSEIAFGSASGMKEIALADVPDSAAGLSRAPAVLAYAITGRDFSASIEVLPLGQFALAQSIADLARYELFLDRDGAMMVRVKYEVRNRSRQFLRVDLPAGSTVLLSKVNEKSTPVTPIHTGSQVSDLAAATSRATDSYLVRLERSRTSVLGMTSFPVELVYACRGRAIEGKGQVELPLPMIDLSVAYAYGTAYLPEGVDYEKFAGVFKKVEEFTSQTAKASLDYGYAEVALQPVSGPPTERPKPKPTPKPAGPGLFSWATGGMAQNAPQPQPKQDANRWLDPSAGVRTPSAAPMRPIDLGLSASQPAGTSQTPIVISDGTVQLPDTNVNASLARNYYRTGMEAYDRGDFEQANRYLKKVQEIAPQSVEAENANKLAANPQMEQFNPKGQGMGKSVSAWGKSGKALEKEVSKELSQLRNELENTQYGFMNQALEAARKGDIQLANTSLTNARALNQKLQEQGESSGGQFARLKKFEAAFEQTRKEAQQQISQMEGALAEHEKAGRFDEALDTAKKLRQLAPSDDLNKKIDELAMKTAVKGMKIAREDAQQQTTAVSNESIRGTSALGSGRTASPAQVSALIQTIQARREIDEKNQPLKEAKKELASIVHKQEDLAQQTQTQEQEQGPPAAQELGRAQQPHVAELEPVQPGDWTTLPPRERDRLTERNRQTAGQAINAIDPFTGAKLPTTQPGGPSGDTFIAPVPSRGDGPATPTPARSGTAYTTFALKNAKAEDVVSILTKMEQDKRKSGDAGGRAVTVDGTLEAAAEPGANSVVLTGNEAAIARAKQLLQALDTSSSDVVGNWRQEQAKLAEKKATYQDGGWTYKPSGDGEGSVTVRQLQQLRPAPSPLNRLEQERQVTRQEEQRKARVASLIARANALEEQKKYPQVLDVLEQVLKLDPQNAYVLDKRGTIPRTGLLRHESDTYKQTQPAEQQQNQVADLRESELPWSGHMTYPKDWREQSARREEYSAQAAGETESNRATRLRLRTRIPKLDFTDLELKDVVEFLGTAASANIHVDWASLAKADVLPTTPVNLALTDVTAEQVLQLVLQYLSTKDKLGYVQDDGVVLISTRDQIAKAPIVRAYDIRDLVVRVPNFAGAVIDLTSSFNNAANNAGNESPFGERNNAAAEENQAARTEIVSQITDTIKQTFDKDSWAPSGTVGSIREINGQLVVTQTAENQDKIARMLDNLRANRRSNVSAPELQARQSIRVPNFAGPVIDGNANNAAGNFAGNFASNNAGNFAGNNVGNDLAVGGTFLDDVQVDFLNRNYDWKLRQDERATQEIVRALTNNDNLTVPVSSFNNDLTPQAAQKLGIQFQAGANGLTYAIIDQAQYRTLLELQTAAGQAAADSRRQLTAVTTDALLANGMTGKVVLAQDRSNTLDVVGNSITLPHDARLVLWNGQNMTVVSTGAVQPFTQPITAPEAIEVPLNIDVPRVGQTIQFEKTLLEPTDLAVLRAQYTQKGK